MTTSKISSVLLALLTSLLTISCSSSDTLISNWDNNNVIIDGSSEEWLKDLKHDSDNKIAYGFKNDSEFLYMCIVFDEPSKLLLMRAGAIVWFEGEDDSKTFGIKYPLRKLSDDRNEQNINRELLNRENPNERIQKYFKNQNELSIVNNEKYPLGQFPIKMNKEGIQLQIGFYQERFVYELRIPLRNNNQYLYCVDADAGEKIVVKFETEEIDLERMENRGGMRPMPGGQRPQQGRGQRLNIPDIEPLNFSVTVQLLKK